MTDATPATRARLPLHWKMAIGFGVGLIVGLIVHATGQGDAGNTSASGSNPLSTIARPQIV